MELIVQGIIKAFELIISFDPEVLGITWLSLKISGIATLISLFIGVSIGTAIALTNFYGKRLVISLINTGMGLPPVVVGLFVTILIWRNGPFGFLEILYTPSAMIIAQAIIATPIVMGISLAAIQNLPPNLRLQILSLGASRLQMVWVLIKEARLPLLAAIMAGFGGVISEVGASIMVGGNIKGYSRVLTTATVMETGKGNFDIAIALSIILLLLAFLVNLHSHTDTAKAASAMNSETLIKIENIILQRGGATVLDIPEFQVPQGRILALIGPNGAGKSTLLLMLAGLLKPQQGKMYFQGQPVESRADLATLRHNAAVVFQEPLLLNSSVYENVALGLKFQKIKK